MHKLSKIIVITLNEQRYGIDIEQVLSIERLEKITGIPRTSAFIKGVIRLREEVIPIIDLKERLEIGSAIESEEARILIVSLGDVQVGLIVDSATDVLDIDANAIDPTPTIVGEVSRMYIQGVAKLEDELLVLLDLNHILNLEEIEEVIQVIEE